MKNLILSALFLVATSLYSNAQTWDFVGDPCSLNGYASIATDQSGVPYLVYSDDAYGNKATVMKYIDDHWVTVGSNGFSAGAMGTASIAIAFDGMPYVAYVDATVSGKATVMKYNGASWETIGASGFSGIITEELNVALGQNDTPYVCYSDLEYGGGRVSVMKYNGSSWVYVGSPGFTDSTVDYTAIAIDKAGPPYIAFSDGYEGKATVLKYTGSGWTAVGSKKFSPGRAHGSNWLAIDTFGNPCVAFQNGPDSFKVTAMRFNGTSWVTIGSGGFSAGGVTIPSIAINADNVPYVVYGDFTDSVKATVMRYNDTAWVTVGPKGFTPYAFNYNYFYLYMALTPAGTPYVSTLCYNAPGDYRTTVMKYGFPEEIRNPSVAISPIIYPNPNSGAFTLAISSITTETARITISSLLGETIEEMTGTTNSKIEIGLDVPSGVYMLSARTRGGVANAKINIMK